MIVGGVAGQRIFRVPGDRHDFEPARQRVVNEKPAGEAFADAEDLLDDLGCLQGADDARHRPEHANLGTVGDEALGRRFRKYAAQRRIGCPGCIFFVRLEQRDVAVERSERRISERPLCQITGVGDEIAGGEIVGTVGDDVVAGDEIERVRRVEAFGVRLDIHERIDAQDRIAGAVNFQAINVGRTVRDLALQIIERYGVIVDDADRADARRRQIQHKR